MFFPLKNFLKINKLCEAHLISWIYLEAVSKIDVIVIIVIKKEDINKGGQLYSCFLYK